VDPKVVRPDEARRIQLYDVLFRYGIGSAETSGRLSMLEVTIPPRTLIKPHLHTREDEFSLVLAGAIGVRQGEQTTEGITTGSWLIKPRSIPHAMWNVSEEPARVLEVVMPGGLERYFEQIAPVLMEHGPDWTKRYDALAAEYGLTNLDDGRDKIMVIYGITL